tara:strand:+ start:338 stop:826 length:489 start_codon:yes stop_codon:yes gene_type:complete
MVITSDFETFVNKYHNNYNVKIDCVIYNNVYNKGIITKYNDKIINDDDIVYYKGQTKGRKDKYILPNTTIYLEKHRGNEYIYIGLVTQVDLISRIPINEFKLSIDKNHIQNGYQSGDKLILVDGLKKGKGSYWAKRSSLLRLGFYDNGNMAEGIIPVNYINE